MIEHLVNFRAASDQINDDLGELSGRILNILGDVNRIEDMTDREKTIQKNLSELLSTILSGLAHSNSYNDSMWKDYTKVVKALGASNDVKNHGD